MGNFDALSNLKTQLGTTLSEAEMQWWLGPQATRWAQEFAATLPSEVALQARRHLGPTHARLLAEWVAARQRHGAKLPAFVAANARFTGLMAEQATPEALALALPWGVVPGQRVLDLTHGLGVDAWAMARAGANVLALEADPSRAILALENHRLLASGNIQVHNTTAEAFLDAYDGPPFDLVYADPDRRPGTTGQRVFSLAQSTPNVLALLPRLLSIGKRIVLKVSPMLDVAWLEAHLPPLRLSLAASVAGELKLLWLELAPGPPSTPERKALVHTGEGAWLSAHLSGYRLPFGSLGQLVFEPDVALYKLDAIGSALGPSSNAVQTGPRGFLVTDQIPLGAAPGRWFRVLQSCPWNPRAMHRALAHSGWNAAMITSRDFPLQPDALRKTLRLKEHYTQALLCTRLHNGQLWAFLAERLPTN